MHPDSLKNLELGKIRALDAAPGDLGKVIGCRAPRTIAWESLIMRLGEMTTSQIRCWGSYGQVQRSGFIGPL